jgi:rhamnosyltransferase
MDDLRVCAAVVTFRPSAEVMDNLALLGGEFAEIVVVDNGSEAVAVKMLHDAGLIQDFTLIENESNVGIAAALNVGAKYALGQGFRWVVLFDQDSSVTAGFVDGMLDGYRKHSRRDFVGIFCPHYVDRATGLSVVTSGLDADGGPVIAMTSGSLMPAWVFERCGWFLEELFIDQVDVEYCFRLREAGYLIARTEARLVHGAGSPRVHQWSVGKFRATHHNARRRYYITRNRLWVVGKFWKYHRAWCMPILRSIATDTIKLLLVEKSKIAKLRGTLAGMRDAMKGRLGKSVEL